MWFYSHICDGGPSQSKNLHCARGGRQRRRRELDGFGGGLVVVVFKEGVMFPFTDCQSIKPQCTTAQSDRQHRKEQGPATEPPLHGHHSFPGRLWTLPDLFQSLQLPLLSTFDSLKGADTNCYLHFWVSFIGWWSRGGGLMSVCVWWPPRRKQTQRWARICTNTLQRLVGRSLTSLGPTHFCHASRSDASAFCWMSTRWFSPYLPPSLPPSLPPPLCPAYMFNSGDGWLIAAVQTTLCAAVGTNKDRKKWQSKDVKIRLCPWYPVLHVSTTTGFISSISDYSRNHQPLFHKLNLHEFLLFP